MFTFPSAGGDDPTLQAQSTLFERNLLGTSLNYDQEPLKEPVMGMKRHVATSQGGLDVLDRRLIRIQFD
jgi:hypothetical protein